jgi:hypothetical protein
MNSVKAEIAINAAAVKIWDALTNPDKIISTQVHSLQPLGMLMTTSLGRVKCMERRL